MCTANQPIFESLITTIQMFAKDADDFTTAKMAFTVLSRMVLEWAGPDINLDPSSNDLTNQKAALPGFNQFMYTRFSPLCWALPSTPNFNAKDAQARQVLAEAGGLQRTIYSKTGSEYIEYLRDQELPSIGMGKELIDEYLNALTMLDLKAFRQFFQVKHTILR